MSFRAPFCPQISTTSPADASQLHFTLSHTRSGSVEHVRAKLGEFGRAIRSARARELGAAFDLRRAPRIAPTVGKGGKEGFKSRLGGAAPN